MYSAPFPAVLGTVSNGWLKTCLDRMCRAEFEGYSDDETVRVVMSGNQEPKSVDITEAAIEQGADVSFLAGCTIPLGAAPAVAMTMPISNCRSCQSS